MEVWGVFLLIGAFFLYLIEKKRAKKEMEEKFKTLSLEALQQSQKSFLSLAKEVFSHYHVDAEKDLAGQKKEIAHLLTPLEKALENMQQQHREMERKREGAYGGLEKLISQLVQSEKDLRLEAANLASALTSPSISGSWGQVHLRRVVELAGMLHQCDFFQEVHVKGDSGQIYRPDLVVKLPGGREIVIDAKVSLSAYLAASQAENELIKKEHLSKHAEKIKRHIKTLRSKEYWKQFPASPEYVILFLPAEAFFSAALQADPSIMELAMGENVVIATPTTLIAILKAVAVGWRQDAISKEAEQIEKLGKELYQRMLVMMKHWNKVGDSLERSIEEYNKASSSLETRVLVTLGKFRGESSEKERPTVSMIEKKAKALSSIRDKISAPQARSKQETQNSYSPWEKEAAEQGGLDTR